MPTTPDEFELGIEDDGSQVELEEGEILVVRLQSNISAGYMWEIEELEKDILLDTESILLPLEEEVMLESELPILGAPVDQILRFKAVAVGQTTLRLVHRRPWEEEVQEPAFTLQVEVVEMLREEEVPPSFNWCDREGCTEIRDQDNCGSCWAFSTVGPFESNIKIKDGLEKDISEQYLVSCNTDGWGCHGGWWAHDYHWNKVPPDEPDAGAVYEADFPYEAADVPCNPPHPHHEKISSWDYVREDYYSVPSVTAIKQAILDYGPVSVAVCVGPSFQRYGGGVFETDETSYCRGRVNHGVVLVGWDDDQGTNGIWYLRNSWGDGWGESGYMQIGYGVSNVGYAASYIVYP